MHDDLDYSVSPPEHPFTIDDAEKACAKIYTALPDYAVKVAYQSRMFASPSAHLQVEDPSGRTHWLIDTNEGFDRWARLHFTR